MKKQIYSKMLLLVAAWLVGTSAAWADDVYKRAITADETNNVVAWSNDDIAEGQWEVTVTDKTYPCSPEINTTNGLYLPGCVRNQEIQHKNISVTDKSILTIDAVWFVGGTTGNNSSYTYFKIGSDISFETYPQAQVGQVVISGSTYTVANSVSKACGNRTDDIWNIHIVINTAEQKITALTVNGEVGSKKATYALADGSTIGIASSATFGTLSLGAVRAAGAMYTGLKSISITEEKQDVTTATVTFKYVDTDGNDLSAYQPDQIYDGAVVGAEISSLISSYNETFFNGESNKYVYAGEYTVEGDYTTVQAGGNTVTLKFTDYPATAYTVMAQVDGADLVAVASGTAFLDGSKKEYFSKFATKDDLWYQTEKPYYVAIDAATINIPYTLMDNVAYCSEAEAIDGLTTWNYGTYVDNMSNGSSAVFADGGTKITTLSETGIYTITGCAIGRADDRYIDFYKNSKDDSNRVLRVVSKNNGGVGSGSFVVTENTNIIADGGYAGGVNGHACDYVYIQKTGEYYESMSIVGDFSENAWDATQGIAMTRSAENPFEWTAVVKDYTITSSKYYYEYKAVGNQDFAVYQLPSGTDNQNYNFDYDGAREGVYTLTFTVNTQNHTVGLAIEKQSVATPAYYIVGNMNEWKVDEAYKMALNESSENEEYKFTMDLTTTSEFKVVKKVGDSEELTWYPNEGDNYGQNGEITADGNYTIYFRPNYDGNEDWFYSCIKVAKNTTDNVKAIKTAAINGTIYNLNGQKVQKAQKGLYIVNGKKVVIK